VVSRKATGSQSQAVTTISVTAVSPRPVGDDEPDVTDVPIGHRLPEPHFRGNVYPIWRRMGCCTPMIRRPTGKLGGR
jgi:hypothetical protein